MEMMIICQFQFITFNIKKRKGNYSVKSLLTIFLQEIKKKDYFLCWNNCDFLSRLTDKNFFYLFF